MTLEGDCRLLRIFLGESDQWRHKPLYNELVEVARRQGLAGATVLRGIEGYGTRSVIHTSRLLTLSEDLPLIVEIIDRADRIEAFLDAAGPMLGGVLVTVERIDVRAYPSSAASPSR